MSQSKLQTFSRGLGADKVEAWVHSLSELELLTLRYDWLSWARPEQVLPDTDWMSAGFLGGRGMGKTRPCAEFVVSAMIDGSARQIGICAQSELRTWEVMVEGESGLLACSPPWFRPDSRDIHDNEITYPNGAKVIVYTPEAPRAIFGPQYDLFWASEIHAWPRTTGMEAWQAIKFGLRLGKARLLWDSNPKPRDPILMGLIAKHRRKPEQHLVIQGATKDNVANLNRRMVEEWYEELGGTTLGKVMLDGDMLEDVDGALWKGSDIKLGPTPTTFERVVIGVDPAITKRIGSDLTGIVVAGLSAGKVYILEDVTGRHAWDAWGDIVCDLYDRYRADKVIVERNRGGDACVSNLRVAARQRGSEVTQTAEGTKYGWQPGIIRVADVVSYAAKTTRAQPVVAAYQRGLVVHTEAMEELEDEMLGWDGTGDSPNRVDALVFAVHELLGMSVQRAAPRPEEVATALRAMSSVGAALTRKGSSGRIY